MNDLHTIHKKNAQAISINIPHLLARGCWVVTEYAGLHVIGCESFSGEGAEQRARAKLQELNTAGNSTHGRLDEPTCDHVGEILARDINPVSLHRVINDDHLAQRLGIAA